MTYFLILKDEAPEKLISSLDEDKVRNEDISFWLLSHQILNIFDDKEIAEQSCASMMRQNPEIKFKIVELHQIDSVQDWN